MKDLKNILIVGGSSYIAKRFINSNKNHYHFKTIVRSKEGDENELVVKDFFDIPDEVFKEVDVVINFAAIVHQHKKIDEKIYDNINYNLVKELANKSKNNGVQLFIQLSTIAVYGDVKHITTETLPVPNTPYGSSKLKADNYLMGLTSSSFNVVIIRPPMVYGEKAPGNMMRLVNLIKKGFPLPFKGISNKRDFIHVENLIGFITASIKHNKTGTFLVSDDNPVSISELVAIISQKLHGKDKMFKLPNWCYKFISVLFPGVYNKLFGSLTIDITQTTSQLNFNPKPLIEVGIDQMLKEIKK